MFSLGRVSVFLLANLVGQSPQSQVCFSMPAWPVGKAGRMVTDTWAASLHNTVQHGQSLSPCLLEKVPGNRLVCIASKKWSGRRWLLSMGDQR
jgi:hypothetical protein